MGLGVLDAGKFRKGRQGPFFRSKTVDEVEWGSPQDNTRRGRMQAAVRILESEMLVLLVAMLLGGLCCKK